MSGLEGTEAGPAGHSGREAVSKEATIRKVVKIHKEEELMFEGKGFHQFLDLFEMAAKNEGAGDYNKVKQVVFFDGWKELNWSKLIKETKARWGRALSKELQELAKVRLIKGRRSWRTGQVGTHYPEMKFKGEVSVEGSVYYRLFGGENEIMR
ncbi:hypothetical protein PPACK8108_LOCUS13723 [Phakopsora pachyrhizi]|uniref:Uncharacterized protein n=1 Tax=Phakopsora pachyrhizi TaxID=170000 RepID=A0AAV0B647_PHAPC|nr:hypothetical protein PPACK8108_LOCUS13723 [Phakopsora pachyrhizi]